MSLGQVGGRMMGLSAAETTPHCNPGQPAGSFSDSTGKKFRPYGRKKRLKTKRCLGRKYNILCSQFSKNWN